MFLIALFIVGVGLYYLGPSITGFVIKEFSYEDTPNLVITSSGNYTWQLQNAGDLKYVKLDGRVTKSGKARVYIENNGIKYLVFDSAQLNESNESGNLITGFAVEEDEDKENDEDKKKKNKKPEWNGDDEIAIKKKTKKKFWFCNSLLLFHPTLHISSRQHFEAAMCNFRSM